MHKNILLDRFPSENIHSFYDLFSKEKFNIPIVTCWGDKIKLDNNTKVYDDVDISSGIYNEETPWSLNSSDIKFISEYEGIFTILLSRSSISPCSWTVSEMSTHIYELVNFWNYHLIKNDIQICFSFYPPHDPSSFALYLISKKLKIPYIFIDNGLVGKKIKFLSCSLQERNLLIRNKYSPSPEWAKEILKNHQKDILSQFELSTPAFMNRNKLIEKKRSLKERLKFRFFLYIEYVAKYKIKSLGKIFSHVINSSFPVAPYCYKYNRKSWHKQLGQISRIKYFFIRRKILKRNKKLLSIYKKLSFKNQNYKNYNYIYFSAPLMPESTVFPFAMQNNSIKIAIRRILNFLPDGWKIVYKTNPFQFSPNFASASNYIDWFSFDFFHEINLSNRIIYAPMDVPADELIKNSRGTASINGSVGYESIAFGKYTLIFSPTWYDELDGVILCKTNQDIIEYFDLITSKNKFVANFPSTKVSNNVIFVEENQIDNDFDKHLYPKIVEKFMSAYEIFNKLDEKKWLI